MHVDSNFLAKQLVIFLKRAIGREYGFELIGECVEEGVDLINCLRGVLLVFPEESGLHDSNNFCMDLHIPFFSSTFFFISYNYMRQQPSG
jgi:hypothetical protein